ncbi:hypothetical protein OAL45_00300 [bacterium]|nr:hypothetical protein [Verrucomicrobiota bacterium]MDC0317876.1 hypothetical protein [bacterium]
MKNKTETALMTIIIVMAALFVANFTILFKIHDDQQIIKDKIEKLNGSQYLNAFLRYERDRYE